MWPRRTPINAPVADDPERRSDEKVLLSCDTVEGNGHQAEGDPDMLTFIGHREQHTVQLFTNNSLVDYNHRVDDPARHLSWLRRNERKNITILLRNNDSLESAFGGSPYLATT